MIFAAPPEEECQAGITDLGGQLGCAVGDASQDILERLFNMLVSGSVWAVEWTGKAWLSFPEPTIGTSTGTPSDNIAQLWSLGSFYILGIAVIGFLMGTVKLMSSPSTRSASGLARGLLAIIAVQTVGIAVTVLLLDAGDQFSVWVVEEASGKDFETAFADFSGLGGVSKTLLAAGALRSLADVAAFAAVGFLLLLLSAVAQVALLIVRSALLVILLAFIPFLAASAFTDGGFKALSRAVGWIFALILYKPVAGIIYAVGVLTLKNAADDATPEEQMLNLLIAVVIVAAAALALPALVKFVAPQAAAGASMAFSGGAVAAGAIGTGAAVVAMGATAGAGGAASAGAGAVKAGGDASPKSGPSTGGTPEGSTTDAGPSSGKPTGPTGGEGGDASTGATDSGSVTDTGSPDGGDTSTESVMSGGDSGSDDSSNPSAPGQGTSTLPTGGGGPETARSGEGTTPSKSSGSSSVDGASASKDHQASPQTSTGSSGSSTHPASDGAEVASTPAPSGSPATSQNPKTSTRSAGSETPPASDGAEVASTPVSTGSTASPGVANAVGSAANSARSGAQDVDFNEGQEGA